MTMCDAIVSGTTLAFTLAEKAKALDAPKALFDTQS